CGSRSSTRCTSCWCSAGRCSSRSRRTAGRGRGFPSAEGARARPAVRAVSRSVSGTVCRSGVLVRVLGVDAQAREQAGQERRECDVGPAGRGDVAGGRQGRTGVAALRRVEEAAGVAAEQAVVLGAGVGGAAGGLAAGAAVVCRAAGTGAGGLRPAGLGRVAGGRAAAALAPTGLALAGGGLGQEGLERGDVLVYGVEHRGDLLAD